MVEHTDPILDSFLRYSTAFATLKPEAVLPFYYEPCLFMSPQGVVALPTHADAVTFFRRVMADLQTEGYQKSNFPVLMVRKLSAILALVEGIGVWQRADGTELRRFGFTYALRFGDGAWRIAMAAVHDPVNAEPAESTVSERIAHHWYLRPVLFVSDLQAALHFYIDKLGFEKRWHSADGRGTVCQVNRGGCEIILCEDAARQDKGRLFVELNRDGIDELRREILERSVPTQNAWWGYDVIRIADPDGNELLFPLDETNDSERRT